MNRKIVFLMGGALIALNIIGLFIMNSFSPNIAYVDNTRIFAEFKGKQEIENKLVNFFSEKRRTLDSLKTEIDFMKRNMNEKNGKAVFASIQTRENRFISMNNQLNEEEYLQRQKQTEEIWNQINQYIQDYGRENKIDFILGAGGNGTLMFGKTDRDITTEVVNYINLRYEGF